MSNVSIQVSGLEGIAEAMIRLAAAIENQEKRVVPIEETTAEPEPAPAPKAEVVKEARPAKVDKPKTSEIELRKKFVEVSRKGFRDELKALLDEFGSPNVSGLTEDVYDEVYARLEAM